MSTTAALRRSRQRMRRARTISGSKVPLGILTAAVGASSFLWRLGLRFPESRPAVGGTSAFDQSAAPAY